MFMTLPRLYIYCEQYYFKLLLIFCTRKNEKACKTEIIFVECSTYTHLAQYLSIQYTILIFDCLSTTISITLVSQTTRNTIIFENILLYEYLCKLHSTISRLFSERVRQRVFQLIVHWHLASYHEPFINKQNPLEL